MVLRAVTLLGCVSIWSVVSDNESTAYEAASCHSTPVVQAEVAVADCGGHRYASRREVRQAKRAERKASRSSCSGRHSVVVVAVPRSVGCSGN